MAAEKDLQQVQAVQARLHEGGVCGEVLGRRTQGERQILRDGVQDGSILGCLLKLCCVSCETMQPSLLDAAVNIKCCENTIEGPMADNELVSMSCQSPQKSDVCWKTTVDPADL